jgi:hypothetical protein
MDQTLLISAPYFDGIALRQQLTDLWNEHSSQDSVLRAKALDLLKQVVTDAREAAKTGTGANAPKASRASRTNSSR